MSNGKGFFAGSQIRQTAPARTLPQCGACGLLKKCDTPKMPVGGGGARRVLFVSATPGVDEDARGAHHVGQDGKHVRRTLRAAGFDLDVDGWHTNAVLCHPGTRRPTAAEIGWCRPNLNKLIKELQPDVIVPMGQPAVAAVVGAIWKEDVGQMATWAGWRIPCQALNAWVCPTWSPGHVIHEDDPVLDRQFREHLAAACALEGKPWPTGPPKWAADVQRVMDPAKAARWLRHAASRQTGAISWDYETNMLKPDGDTARIVSCAVAWGRGGPEKCIAYPWVGEAITATGELLRSPVPKIGANLKFEDRWTRKEFGHRVRGWAWDAMLAAHVCDNRTGVTSVKFQSFVRLGVPVWNEKIEPFLKSKGDERTNKIFEEIDVYDLLTYNGLDALLEFRLAVDQIKELGYPTPWRT